MEISTPMFRILSVVLSIAQRATEMSTDRAAITVSVHRTTAPLSSISVRRQPSLPSHRSSSSSSHHNNARRHHHASLLLPHRVISVPSSFSVQPLLWFARGTTASPPFLYAKLRLTATAQSHAVQSSCWSARNSTFLSSVQAQRHLRPSATAPQPPA
ncbi:ring-cleaving dioxygenase [Sesbania bispinosa]|nr:ring-cleaving dioxygenase [Sesbania bispinosa]